MKTMSRALLLLGVPLVCGTTVTAQSSLQATVPFDFQVGNHAMPAGAYRLTPAISLPTHTFLLQSVKRGGPSMFVTVVSQDSREATPKLIFHRNADGYLLSDIWGDSGKCRVTLPKSEQAVAQNRGEALSIAAVAGR
jgi:hypothetical protein